MITMSTRVTRSSLQQVYTVVSDQAEKKSLPSELQQPTNAVQGTEVQENRSSSLFSVYNSISSAMTNMSSYLVGWWDRTPAAAVQPTQTSVDVIPCLAIVPYKDWQAYVTKSSRKSSNLKKYQSLVLHYGKLMTAHLSTPPNCDLLCKFLRPEVFVEVRCSRAFMEKISVIMKELDAQAKVSLSTADFFSNIQIIQIFIVKPCTIPMLAYYNDPCSEPQVKIIINLDCVAREVNDTIHYIGQIDLPVFQRDHTIEATSGREIVLYKDVLQSYRVGKATPVSPQDVFMRIARYIKFMCELQSHCNVDNKETTVTSTEATDKDQNEPQPEEVTYPPHLTSPDADNQLPGPYVYTTYEHVKTKQSYIVNCFEDDICPTVEQEQSVDEDVEAVKNEDVQATGEAYTPESPEIEEEEDYITKAPLNVDDTTNIVDEAKTDDSTVILEDEEEEEGEEEGYIQSGYASYGSLATRSVGRPNLESAVQQPPRIETITYQHFVSVPPVAYEMHDQEFCEPTVHSNLQNEEPLNGTATHELVATSFVQAGSHTELQYVNANGIFSSQSATQEHESTVQQSPRIEAITYQDFVSEPPVAYKTDVQESPEPTIKSNLNEEPLSETATNELVAAEFAQEENHSEHQYINANDVLSSQSGAKEDEKQSKEDKNLPSLQEEAGVKTDKKAESGEGEDHKRSHGKKVHVCNCSFCSKNSGYESDDYQAYTPQNRSVDSYDPFLSRTSSNSSILTDYTFIDVTEMEQEPTGGLPVPKLLFDVNSNVNSNGISCTRTALKRRCSGDPMLDSGRGFKNQITMNLSEEMEIDWTYMQRQFVLEVPVESVHVPSGISATSFLSGNGSAHVNQHPIPQCMPTANNNAFALNPSSFNPNQNVFGGSAQIGLFQGQSTQQASASNPFMPRQSSFSTGQNAFGIPFRKGQTTSSASIGNLFMLRPSSLGTCQNGPFQTGQSTSPASIGNPFMLRPSTLGTGQNGSFQTGQSTSPASIGNPFMLRPSSLGTGQNVFGSSHTGQSTSPASIANPFMLRPSSLGTFQNGPFQTGQSPSTASIGNPFMLRPSSLGTGQNVFGSSQTGQSTSNTPAGNPFMLRPSSLGANQNSSQSGLFQTGQFCNATSAGNPLMVNAFNTNQNLPGSSSQTGFFSHIPLNPFKIREPEEMDLDYIISPVDEFWYGKEFMTYLQYLRDKDHTFFEGKCFDCGPYCCLDHMKAKFYQDHPKQIDESFKGFPVESFTWGTSRAHQMDTSSKPENENNVRIVNQPEPGPVFTNLNFTWDKPDYSGQQQQTTSDKEKSEKLPMVFEFSPPINLLEKYGLRRPMSDTKSAEDNQQPPPTAENIPAPELDSTSGSAKQTKSGKKVRFLDEVDKEKTTPVQTAFAFTESSLSSIVCNQQKAAESDLTTVKEKETGKVDGQTVKVSDDKEAEKCREEAPNASKESATAIPLPSQSTPTVVSEAVINTEPAKTTQIQSSATKNKTPDLTFTLPLLAGIKRKFSKEKPSNGEDTEFEIPCKRRKLMKEDGDTLDIVDVLSTSTNGASLKKSRRPSVESKLHNATIAKSISGNYDAASPFKVGRTGLLKSNDAVENVVAKAIANEENKQQDTNSTMVVKCHVPEIKPSRCCEDVPATVHQIETKNETKSPLVSGEPRVKVVFPDADEDGEDEEDDEVIAATSSSQRDAETSTAEEKPLFSKCDLTKMKFTIPNDFYKSYSKNERYDIPSYTDDIAPKRDGPAPKREVIAPKWTSSHKDTKFLQKPKFYKSDEAKGKFIPQRNDYRPNPGYNNKPRVFRNESRRNFYRSGPHQASSADTYVQDERRTQWRNAEPNKSRRNYQSRHPYASHTKSKTWVKDTGKGGRPCDIKEANKDLSRLKAQIASEIRRIRVMVDERQKKATVNKKSNPLTDNKANNKKGKPLSENKSANKKDEPLTENKTDNKKGKPLTETEASKETPRYSEDDLRSRLEARRKARSSSVNSGRGNGSRPCPYERRCQKPHETQGSQGRGSGRGTASRPSPYSSKYQEPYETPELDEEPVPKKPKEFHGPKATHGNQHYGTFESNIDQVPTKVSYRKRSIDNGQNVAEKPVVRPKSPRIEDDFQASERERQQITSQERSVNRSTVNEGASTSFAGNNATVAQNATNDIKQPGQPTANGQNIKRKRPWVKAAPDAKANKNNVNSRPTIIRRPRKA